MPSLTQLEYIVAVDKARHFGKAADSCHVTQPTLSMQIQKVEEEIGYPLFDRLKKPIVPTSKGQRFIAQAKILLHEHHKLMEMSRQQGDEPTGDFRLGVIPTIAPYLLPVFIEAFSKKFPKVQLVVDELKTDTILEMLHDDRLDAAILATPLNESGLHERPIFYEPFSLYVAKGHPLSARKRIKEDDLKGDEMWLLADGHCFRQQIVRYCSLRNQDGVFPNVHFEGGNIDTLRYLIRKSRGYTLVPALFVETLSEAEKRDHIRDFEKPAPSREVSLIYRRDQWKSDILKSLEETIRERLPKELTRFDPKRQDVVPLD
ncbi:MAG TPA: LysR substrate-binding domain-containing protein [Bdellovibrionales bacterium]|nr:LysR substrate-binding domain-containing protein [Bdellovibrionales bacterium]